MTNTITLHVLQQVPVSRANRGEDGSPKSINFGGVTRARFSSQSIKRAQRTQTKSEIPAYRTKKPWELLARELGDVNADDLTVLRDVMTQVYGKVDDAGRLLTMVFLGDDEVQRMAAAFAEQRLELGELRRAAQDAPKNKEAQANYAAALSQVAAMMRPMSTSPAVALFGRFNADDENWTVEAATSYAHAISVHRAATQADFFSAVDDVSGRVEHIGNADLTAPLMYRMATLDIEQLRRNLGREDVEDVVQEWAQGFLYATPTGGQHGAFARTLPEVVMVEARRGGLPLSLANAYSEALYPEGNETLLSKARQALVSTAERQEALYGKNGEVTRHLIELGNAESLSLTDALSDAYSQVQ